ncbi:hypothetical protein [Gynuella sunshinyii]|uniref:Uncharacterized protein n=1 Tax=Gynuella sunshinyii YC6258 TaxID=1445510 RepID=A0A0C5VA45_9GAMM|nr:hypothetical protein [Gynuella sunshinyii]AJQ96210.1 hypothetical Protein YC6258_04174 [Gynuella sunshinyii YC6258]
MNFINSYLKIDNDFVHIRDFSGRLPDKFYIEGALELDINGIRLIDKSNWDYIDQLWFILVSGVEHVLNGQHYMGYFPDQPIEVIFKNLNDIYVEIRIDSKVAVTEKTKALPLILEGALDFFKVLLPLVDEDPGIQQEMLKMEQLLLPLKR